MPVALTAIWTLAYQLVLVTRLPAWSSVAFFFGASILVLIGDVCWTKALARWRYEFHWSHLLLLALGVGAGVTVLFVLRPNQDDIVYFHRALTQLSHLSDPILTRQTSVDVDAAAFSPVHLATSHEMLMAFLAHFLGGDPLYFYQIVGHVVAAFSMPFVFYFCARCFNVNRWTAALGAACVLLFLLIDSPGQASFGNTAFARMWQGKAMVWVLFPPVALSLTYRFMTTGDRRNIVWLTLLGISGVGLSNSALYLIPATVGCSALAALGIQLAEQKEMTAFWTHFRRSTALAIPLAYPVSILLLLKLNVIPQPIDKHGFGPAVIPWIEGIRYVVGRPQELFRDIIVLLVFPLMIIRGKRGRFLFFYICAIFALCLNPLLAHFWMKDITAACYFRLVYLMPLPFLFTFLPQAIRRGSDESGLNQARAWRLTGAIVIVVVCAWSYRGLSIQPRNRTLGWKSPLAYQILPSNLQFARAARPYIAQSKLLAPTWTASCELPLLFPRMKVVAPRLATHYFSNAGKREEGALRRMAQAFLEGEQPVDPQRVAALTRSFTTVISSGRATAVAVPDKESRKVLAALQAVDPGWHRVLEAGGLVLMLPQAAAKDRHATSR